MKTSKLPEQFIEDIRLSGSRIEILKIPSIEHLLKSLTSQSSITIIFPEPSMLDDQKTARIWDVLFVDFSFFALFVGERKVVVALTLFLARNSHKCVKNATFQHSRTCSTQFKS